MAPTAVERIRTEEYEARRRVALLRERVFTGGELGATLQELQVVEATLAALEKKRGKAEVKADEGVVVSTQRDQHLLGVESTGIIATVTLRMAQIPTAIYHLFRKHDHPLISGEISNQSDQKIRRLRVISQISDYSVEAVDTLEIRQNQPATFDQLPTLLPERTASVEELTRATVSVLVEDLDKQGTGIELHRTEPIWMLAKTTAPYAVNDPAKGEWRDLTQYFGAFVTPNDPTVMAFLSNVRAAHPEHQLVGYQTGAPGVEAQVRAIYTALKAANVSYVNSTIAFSPEDGTRVQRVRLPAETLVTPNANCLDGTVLFASLIEAMSMNAAIVTMPGHAIVAWEMTKNGGDWDYLDTTLIGGHDFEAAVTRGREFGKAFAQQFASTKDAKYHRWSIRELRGLGITPTH